MGKPLGLYDRRNPPQGWQCPFYWTGRRRVLVPAVRQPSILLGALFAVLVFGIGSVGWMVSSVITWFREGAQNPGTTILLGVLLGLFWSAVVVFILWYSVRLGTSFTWFDQEGAHVFYILEPVAVVPWGALLVEGRLLQDDLGSPFDGEMGIPLVVVTVPGIPEGYLPGFFRLGVWARRRGPLMRRMRRVLCWADHMGYLDEAKRHLDDGPGPA